jgi:hypothetical protein
MTKDPRPASSFAPLRYPVFAVIWRATLLGNTGSFLRDVASSWLVTNLSASPAAVSMSQAAATQACLECRCRFARGNPAISSGARSPGGAAFLRH